MSDIGEAEPQAKQQLRLMDATGMALARWGLDPPSLPDVANFLLIKTHGLSQFGWHFLIYMFHEFVRVSFWRLGGTTRRVLEMTSREI